ncbi:MULTISPECIES: helix-turn-helix domain-containing protein [unclassified Microbacterium]|uniref:helix-turn-helix domain-containing protein n=1 Tax=unclassified Microbacterium TaxID=2609290 RepID=UPI000EAA5663|nr:MULTISPECIES: AraC family transcriptional regulator [unclassified Microbacterium]MBT2483865.1 helix-turn-helix transcriptional regulator [Microbacterium sp. ISL-108]RKN66847.1 AraC family transcriptional regulator [Microbacterium sp. CGR2]
MVTVDADALSQVLGAVDLRVGVGRGTTLAAGALLPLPLGRVTLVYIAEGSVHGQPPLARGCRLDVDSDGDTLTVEPFARPEPLVAGDAFLTLGRSPLGLEAEEATSLIVVDLELADAGSPLHAVLPDSITVTGFDALEPAAAALARNMGTVDASTKPVRNGDPVICRMMAMTVLLSVIRAWAANGCAPAGWPSLSNDPFLDRVIDAIHEEPGRDWTVERLAGVGAMSRSTFAERFRTVIGRSPADYVTEVRIEAAKRMLDTGRTVSDVSRELGYASDEGFSRAFRRRTGMTPSSWRMAHRAPVPA